MRKTFLTLCAVFTSIIACFAQLDVPNNGYNGGGPLTNGSWLRFTSGGDATSIQENWGLNISGTTRQPVKVVNTSFMVGYTSVNQDLGTGNALISGNVGIGTQAPVTSLDVAGNQTLRNSQNITGGGASIHFTSYGADSKGPMIRSYLDFAQGDQSASRLILSSYNNGYKDELTLSNGSVGIGTISPDGAYKLSVNGNIRSKEVKVEAGWSDYVFKKDYQLRTLPEVEAYIKRQGHLPEVPSAEEVEKSGINVGETESLLLKKIEELTLYLIEKDKEVKDLKLKVENGDKKAEQLILQSLKNQDLELRLSKLELLLTKSVTKE